MYRKHNKFNDEEQDIIERGKSGNLKNIQEMNYYLGYLKVFKDECIDELFNYYYNKNFVWEYIGGVCLCSLGGGFFGLVSLMCGNIPLAVVFGILFMAGIIVPSVINKGRAKNAYNLEVEDLEAAIKKEQKKLEQVRIREEKIRQQEKDELLKKDGFLLDIANDITRIENFPYKGCERDVLALKSLGIKYLAMKKKLGVLNATEVLSRYPIFNQLIIGIEAKIEGNILFNERQKMDRAVLGEKIDNMPEIMSDEELNSYLADKEITLELK